MGLQKFTNVLKLRTVRTGTCQDYLIGQQDNHAVENSSNNNS